MKDGDMHLFCSSKQSFN